MPSIDRFIELMPPQPGARLVLANDEPVMLHHADGTSASLSDPFSSTQIQELLYEIVPDQYRPSLVTGAPFRFSYTSVSGAMDIEISQADGNIRVCIVHIATSSPTSAGQAGQIELPSAASAPSQPGGLRSALPVKIPWVLQWPAARLQMFGAICGMVLGMVTSALAFLLASPDSLLGQMFNLRSFTTAIPVSISCMFCWAAAICGLRGVRLRHLERFSSHGLLVEATRVLSATGPAGLLEALKGEVCQVSPPLRRPHAVVRQWGIRPSLQDADLVLQQHVANDQEAVYGGYNLVRTFVWALPVLGLIGTVIGISLAVGGFAQCLGGNIEDVAAIKMSLVSVTTGLAFAFLITLQGLLTSLPTMLASSALQTREENLYASIQQGITDTFLPVLQRVAPESTPVADEDGLRVWRGTLQRTADGVLQTIRDESMRLIGDMETRQAAHRQEVSEWAQTLRQETEAGAMRLGEVADRLGTALATTSTEFVERLAAVREALDQRGAELRVMLETQAHAMGQQHAEMLTAMSEQSNTVRATADILAGLTDTTRTALECQATLQAAMQQWRESNFESTFAGFVEALATQSRELRATTDAVRELTTTTSEMLTSQATLQEGVRQWRESGFEHTLTALRDPLVALAPILESFRKPFVLQAVPVNGDGRTAE